MLQTISFRKVAEVTEWVLIQNTGKNYTCYKQQLIKKGSIISAHYLFSINKPLLENAVVISDSVSIGRHGEGGHGVQEAGSKAAETAVAQTGVLLHVLQLLNVKSHLDTGAKDGGGWSEVRYTAHGLCKVIIVGVVSAVVVVVGGRGSGGLQEDGEEAGEQKKETSVIMVEK